MAASQNLLIREDDLGVLGVDDARIPDDVRAHFTGYDALVATVVPVISMCREEWWLFDAEGAVIDMLCRHVEPAGRAIRDPAVRNIVHRAIHADRL